MNLFSRIAIGTANWDHEYNGARVSDEDQKRILGYAQCEGIDTIDTATAYGWDWTKANSFFDVVVKVKQGDDIEAVKQTNPHCLMAHDNDCRELCCKSGVLWGMSCYDTVDLNGTPPDLVQVPYSLYDRRWEAAIGGLQAVDYDDLPCEIHVRSIFLRGKILKEASPQECIQFCLCNPNIDKVIVGADSFEQFRDNLRFLHKWKNLEKHDLKLIDTRNWRT